MVVEIYIGEKLIDLRSAVGLSQDELADKLGIKRSKVADWENNRTLPKAHEIIELAKFFNTSCDMILRGIQPEFSEIHNLTGLSNDAIRTLINTNSEIQFFRKSNSSADGLDFSAHITHGKLRQNVINALLVDGNINRISSAIYFYLQAVKKELTNMDDRDRNIINRSDSADEILQQQELESSFNFMKNNIAYAQWWITEAIKDFIISITEQSIQDDRVRGDQNNAKQSKKG